MDIKEVQCHLRGEQINKSHIDLLQAANGDEKGMGNVPAIVFTKIRN
jgi:hypothetical protein